MTPDPQEWLNTHEDDEQERSHRGFVLGRQIYFWSGALVAAALVVGWLSGWFR